MARRRNFRKGSYYHIYARGIKKEEIFQDFQDYIRFLRRLSRYKAETKDQIIQFCIMPNHYHILVKAYSHKSISRMMQKLGSAYGRYYSFKYRQSGYVFQNRFNAKRITSIEYFLHVSRYIHRNALEVEGITEHNLDEYIWSSFPKFIKPNARSLVKLDNRCIMKYFSSPKEYEEFCLTSDLIAKRWIRKMVQNSGLTY